MEAGMKICESQHEDIFMAARIFATVGKDTS